MRADPGRRREVAAQKPISAAHASPLDRTSGIMCGLGGEGLRSLYICVVLDYTTVTVRERCMPDANPEGISSSSPDLDSERLGYRGPTVCEIVGITYRQLDYWARTELVVPSVRRTTGRGVQRLYSFDDVVQLRVIKRLLDAGVSLGRVRATIEELRTRGGSLTDATLVSDGTGVHAVDDANRMVELLTSGQGVFAIALGPVIEGLRAEVAEFPAERLPAEQAAIVGDNKASSA